MPTTSQKTGRERVLPSERARKVLRQGCLRHQRLETIDMTGARHDADTCAGACVAGWRWRPIVALDWLLVCIGHRLAEPLGVVIHVRESETRH